MPDGMRVCTSNGYNALWYGNVMGHRHGMSPGWVRKQLYLYQVMMGVSHGMEESLQNTWETK